MVQEMPAGAIVQECHESNQLLPDWMFYSTSQDKFHPKMNWNHSQPRSVIRQVLHPNGGGYCYATKQT